MFPPEEYKSAAIKAALLKPCRAAKGTRFAGRQRWGAVRKAEEQRWLAAAAPGSSTERTRRARPFLLRTALLASTPLEPHPQGCSLGRIE